MDKITVSELLAQHELTWFGLYRRSRGSISKSMAHDWVRGAHKPNRRSAVKIAVALGIPSAHLLGILETRERTENHPKPPIFCLLCRRKLYKMPNPTQFDGVPETEKTTLAA